MVKSAPHTKIFSGKRYTLASGTGTGYGTQSNAKKLAQKYRSRGMNARVFKYTEKAHKMGGRGFTEYVVYVR